MQRRIDEEPPLEIRNDTAVIAAYLGEGDEDDPDAPIAEDAPPAPVTEAMAGAPGQDMSVAAPPGTGAP